MNRKQIAVIPGDGVGPEVTAAALEVLSAAAEHDSDFTYSLTHFPWGSEYYGLTGAMMDSNALETLAPFDAIVFGAVGSAEVPDHVSLWGLRLKIVQGFDQAISLRPAKLFSGVRCPLADRSPNEVDIIVVRENTEGEYSGVGGFSHRDTPMEVALQTAVYTRSAIERTARFAFELARTRPAQRLASITKSNASLHASVLWDEVIIAVAADYPEVDTESVLVDAAAARLVLDPSSFDVIVAANLYGDILSDLTGALSGSLGMAPSCNLSLDKARPSMYEPVHGSALDIAGRGIANPIGAILSIAMMAEDLGAPQLSSVVRASVETCCEKRTLTPDAGGVSSTAEVTAAIIAGVHDEARRRNRATPQ